MRWNCRIIAFGIAHVKTGLRGSEALNLSPSSVEKFDRKPVLSIVGKGNKRRLVACPERLTEKLKAFAFEKKIDQGEGFFPINRFRACEILKEASNKAGFTKTIYPHLLRQSDAIERLRQIGNPEALQLHLGHSPTVIAVRYLFNPHPGGSCQNQPGGSV